jgi:hypothetical protein
MATAASIVPDDQLPAASFCAEYRPWRNEQAHFSAEDESVTRPIVLPDEVLLGFFDLVATVTSYCWQRQHMTCSSGALRSKGELLSVAAVEVSTVSLKFDGRRYEVHARSSKSIP